MGTYTRREGLPPKFFFYTLEQIAHFLQVEESTVKAQYLHFDGRSTGACPRDKMRAVDVSPSDAEGVEWRVLEADLIRWMRFKGYRYHERGYVK